MYLNKFSNLKPKTKNVERYYEYLTIIINSFINGFKVNINDCLDLDTFWTLLINNGKIGCTIDNNNLPHIGTLTYKTGLDENGKMCPDGIICLNGNTYKGVTLPIKLFYTDEPIMIFSRFADRLAEVDLSQEVLVQTTRAGQIIPVTSVNEKNKVDRCFQNIKNGELQTYVLDWSPFEEGKTPLEIFDPSKFQSMEYLSSYHAELCRRLYGLFGFACQGKNKQAQVTEDELDGHKAPSVIMPMLILENIKNCFDKINETFNVNFSIEPSDLLNRQITDVLTDETAMKEGVNDETITDTE